MRINEIINSNNLFKSEDIIKIDPDRADLVDIKDEILPIIIKLAYKQLVSDKAKFEKKFGEYDENDPDSLKFEFTIEELNDITETLLLNFKEKLVDISSSDIKKIIKNLSIDFKFPLEK